ncbi:hypothetical protein AOLI_G00194430 [Acnodon oligacanthus]
MSSSSRSVPTRSPTHSVYLLPGCHLAPCMDCDGAPKEPGPHNPPFVLSLIGFGTGRGGGKRINAGGITKAEERNIITLRHIQSGSSGSPIHQAERHWLLLWINDGEKINQAEGRPRTVPSPSTEETDSQRPFCPEVWPSLIMHSWELHLC